jgi:hypothetical protein
MSSSSTTCPAGDALAVATDEQRLVDFIRDQAATRERFRPASA